MDVQKQSTHTVVVQGGRVFRLGIKPLRKMQFPHSYSPPSQESGTWERCIHAALKEKAIIILQKILHGFVHLEKKLLNLFHSKPSVFILVHNCLSLIFSYFVDFFNWNVHVVLLGAKRESEYSAWPYISIKEGEERVFEISPLNQSRSALLPVVFLLFIKPHPSYSQGVPGVCTSYGQGVLWCIWSLFN